MAPLAEIRSDTKMQQVKISCKNLWKIFGPRPQQALDLVKGFSTKEETLEKTGHVVAVKDVSFDVFEGEIFVIMGLSGSGKSTLVRCLNGLNKPTQGEVLIDGVDLSSMNDQDLRSTRRHKISMVFQHFALFPHRTVLENIAYGLELQGVDKIQRAKRALSILDMVGLQGWEHNYPEELSGGMQQRVGLARALALDPEILLMDEAFSALDPLIRRQMHDEFIKLMSRVKKTIVFITHDLNEAIRLGSRIAIMKNGEIIQIGTPEEIVSNPGDDYVIEFVRDVAREKILEAQSIMSTPKLKLYLDQTPEECLNRLKAIKLDQAFVVDSNERLMGAISIEGLRQAMARNAVQLADMSLDTAFQVGSDQPIGAIIPLMAACDNTVAVVDDNTRLLGEVPRVALLKALVGKEAGDANH